ncbi:hex-4 [Cordylochernes scorpioides]|uniref:Hex-4 n=1 Tax=Cordylochernes scorpioides TaxID=51811 RepID=A0ABY6L3W9_9ARAC|nr:hex-4 [Cordylochernes scorpioides]
MSRAFNNIIKPPSDERSYRGLELANGLKVQTKAEVLRGPPCPGTFLLVVYMMRSSSLTQDDDIVVSKFTRQNKMKALNNINDLMPLTQPHEHLQKQKLYESMVHSPKLELRWKDKPVALQGFTSLNGVHIDLKGAPFKIEFFRLLFPYLNKLGATGILIEYEIHFLIRMISQPTMPTPTKI